MQKLKLTLIFIFTLILSINGWTAIPSSPNSSHTNIYKFDKTAFRIAQMRYFTNLSLKEYEKLKGKKLNVFEKFSFKTSQRRAKKLITSYDREGTLNVLQKIGWLLKGIVLGPIAIAIGYIFLKDEEREYIKWIWFGFAGWVVVLALVLIIV